MKNEKILKIDDIVVNDQYYPRVVCDYQVVEKYAKAMKSGAKFPPISVAKINLQYFLIDGLHRLQAVQFNEEEHIKVKVIEGMDFVGLYIAAIKANVAHGNPLTVNDENKIIKQLTKMQFDPPRISKLLSVPLDEITRILPKDISLITKRKSTPNFESNTIMMDEKVREFYAFLKRLKKHHVSSKLEIELFKVKKFLDKYEWREKHET